MDQFEVLLPQSFSDEFESGSEVFESLGESFEGEFGRRGASMRARPPVQRLPPRRLTRPSRPRPRPRPLPWPAWPPYGGGYAMPVVVERAGGFDASTPEQQRCMQECLSRGSASPAPPEPGADGADSADTSATTDGAGGDAPSPPSSEFGEYESQGEGEFEFEFETVAPAATRTAQRPASASCTNYERGEVQKSTTALGHLAADVTMHPRGLLIADFGVDWRTPREALKRDAVLRNWLKTIVELIRANPTTTIRMLGFSDCIGTERNNRTLRRGRALRVLALLQKMAGRAAWAIIKPKLKPTDAAPDGDYVASNATIEGRAQNRSVLIEYQRTIDFTPQVVKSCAISRKQAATYELLGLIPNLPGGKAAVPIAYKLNAQELVGKVAKDLRSNGKSAHFWTVMVEAADAGITAAEIAGIVAEGSALALGMAIAGPLLALAASFLALGSGYYQAAQIEAKKWAASGFSRGVVMGADKRKAALLNDYFRNACCPPNPFSDQIRQVSIANYRIGMLVGYVQGRLLCPNQRSLFWRDLGSRMGDQSIRGPSKQWTRRGWMDWYTDAAAAFRGAHLE